MTTYASANDRSGNAERMAAIFKQKTRDEWSDFFEGTAAFVEKRPPAFIGA